MRGREVLGPIGVDKSTCRVVVKSLRESGGEEEASPESRMNDIETGSLRWKKDCLTAFLLKFGQGMEEVPTRRLYIFAFTIGMGCLIGGLIPLIPYFFIPHTQIALIDLCSSIVTGVTGASSLAYGIVWGAVGMSLVGGIAAGVAFGIVRALEGEQLLPILSPHVPPWSLHAAFCQPKRYMIKDFTQALI
ncbi:hypothetical protein K435DRAFT_811406 [Dendrothele bispora CBS 962.96]|uniref:Uncharacterized protein n=1 Tax=Dendrothele bispora (strain CBS 962.96) TaxID=1314807 RepID=A0A4S8KS59_DENBC|nr:hypothetical protein K435DRAFT_811406 [Dendrothele bispora CBS 962.96]